MSTTISLTCSYCSTAFEKKQKDFKSNSKNEYFCERKCFNLRRRKRTEVSCTNCKFLFMKKTCDVTENNFCSQHCMAIFGNANRKIDPRLMRKSKAEIYLHEKFQKLFPMTIIECNNRKICKGLELDFYIPEWNMAIELNGPLHYFPIYGKEKLNKIIERDQRKTKIAQKLSMTLLILDISSFKTPKSTFCFIDNFFDKLVQLRKIHESNATPLDAICFQDSPQPSQDYLPIQICLCQRIRTSVLGATPHHASTNF